VKVVQATRYREILHPCGPSQKGHFDQKSSEAMSLVGQQVKPSGSIVAYQRWHSVGSLIPETNALGELLVSTSQTLVALF
jgi:hypothetical protein